MSALADGTTPPASEPSHDEIAEQIRALPVGVLISNGRLDTRLARLRQARRRQLDEVRLAIDAIGALAPDCSKAGSRQTRSAISAALANLQIAYADAVTGHPVLSL